MRVSYLDEGAHEPAYLVVDLRAPAQLHLPKRAAMDRAHPLHRAHLRLRLVAQPHVLQQQQLLHLLQHRERLLRG